MIKKGFFGLLVITCLYATLSTVQVLSDQNLKPKASQYFSKLDNKIYAISHPNTIDLEKENIQTIDLNSDLYQSLSQSIPDNCTVYMSQKRGVVVFEGAYEWNDGSIKELFLNGKHKVNFTGHHELIYGAYNGFYSKNVLVLFESTLKIDKGQVEFQVDNKASHTVIDVGAEINVTDYYRKKEALISYEQETSNTKKCRNINDQDVFANFIPAEFDYYEFFEKDYLKSIDSVFSASPISNWTKTGLLFLKKDNIPFVIIEMKNGQKALENMSELYGDYQSNENYGFFKNIKLTSFFDSSITSGLYVSDLQGYAIIAPNKLLFDQLGTEISLGNSLRTNKSKMKQLYQILPRDVLHRVSRSNGTQSSLCQVGRQRIRTTVKVDKEQILNDTEDFKGYFAMNPSEKIISFYAYSGRGNTFLVTESNKWIRYENGIRMWEKTFDTKVVKEPKLMEMSTEKNQDISILFENEALIVDKDGRILNRFPTSGAVHPIRFRLKNKISFLIPNTRTMSVTDNDGREKSVYTFSSRILDMVLFKEDGRKHVGVLCEKTYFIIDLEQKRTKRKIQIADEYLLLKYDASSVLLSENGNHTIDLLGKQSELKMPEGFTYMNSFHNGDLLELLYANGNELISVNSFGQFIWQKTMKCASIDRISIFSKDDRPIQIGILDGIENKIVLLSPKDLTIENVKRHGEKQLQLTTYDHRGISITTFLGDILIQYTKF
ncbi:MAG: hypothetical protein QNL10_05100 [Crocinitomicaceae bacterium]|jgi:hypothetical protein|tara:strand:+ start:4085 stop:6241 length:2157 start_codon:yes stop_codon:yes gene_type:complete